MLRKKKLELKLVPDKDQEYWHPPKPIEVEEVVQAVVTAYILMKGFSTLCSAAEHIVVTKVK